MPKIQSWDNFPAGVRRHLIDRMRDRSIGIADLNQLRLWIETRPEVPETEWYKDFGSFKICGRGSYPKTFLLRGQPQRDKPSEGSARPPQPTTRKPKCSTNGSKS